jgi:hypothetical protein
MRWPEFLDRFFFSVRDKIVEDDGHIYQVVKFYGLTLDLLFLLEIQDGELNLKGFSIGGPGPGKSNKQVYRIMRLYGRHMAQKYDVKKVTIFGGKRTTGAKPGRNPSKMVIFQSN